MTDIVCELHGGAIAKADGTWLCCWQEEYAVFPQTPPEPRFNPPPADFADRVAAARASRDDQGDETNA